MERTKSSAASKGRIVYSTSEGRQKFPDLAQMTFGDKVMIGFDRYGRTICALTPIEAVKVLAEWGDDVDDRLRQHLREAARSLLRQLGEAPDEAADEKAKPDLMNLEDVDSRRHAKGSVSHDKPVRKPPRRVGAR